MAEAAARPALAQQGPERRLSTRGFTSYEAFKIRVRVEKFLPSFDPREYWGKRQLLISISQGGFEAVILTGTSLPIPLPSKGKCTSLLCPVGTTAGVSSLQRTPGEFPKGQIPAGVPGGPGLIPIPPVSGVGGSPPLPASQRNRGAGTLK